MSPVIQSAGFRIVEICSIAPRKGLYVAYSGLQASNKACLAAACCMEFRVEGNLQWKGVAPDACVRGKVGSGWWVGVKVYCEVEKWTDILRTAYLYHTWAGIIGLVACRKPGCPSGVFHFHQKEIVQHFWVLPTLDHRFCF